MRRSRDVEELVRSFFRAMSQKRNADVAALFTADAGVMAIGTSAEEWWSGPDLVRAALLTQVVEMPTFGYTIEDLLGWADGPVGWAAAQVRVEPDGVEPLLLRLSLVARTEGNHWSIVQWHVSVGIGNEETVGVPITTSIGALLEAVRGRAEPVLQQAEFTGDVTVVFTDIEGSTAMLDRMGDAAWRDLINWHRDIVEREADRRRGRVVQWLGDGFMLVFPSATAAAGFAVAVQRSLVKGWGDEGVRVRMGMHTGDALVEGDDFFGRTIVMAARIAAAATGEQIFVTDGVRDDLQREFQFDKPLSLRFKGFDGVHAAHPLMWRTAT